MAIRDFFLEPQYNVISVSRQRFAYDTMDDTAMQEPYCFVAESGVSIGSPSDLGHSEEECEKTRVSHRHSLPHLQHSSGSNR